MNETTSAVEDFDELKLTEEEETVVLEVEVPDDERDAMLEKIRMVATDDSDIRSAHLAVYKNWDEMAAVAVLKKSGGVW